MLKLIAHLIVAALLWFGTTALGFNIAGRIVVIVIGAFAVHFIWERIFHSPYDYLGAMQVSLDDPIMKDAVQRAKETWPAFVAVYPEHREDSVVRFRLRNDRGAVENVWGDLLELTPAEAKVYLRTLPVEHSGPLDRNMTVPIEDITDWQLEFHDGTLAGGYTNRAMFKIFERQQGYMHPKFEKHMSRFVELGEKK